MGNTLKLEELLKPDCVPDESAGGENWRILHGDRIRQFSPPADSSGTQSGFK